MGQGNGWYASVSGSKGKGESQGIGQTYNVSTVEAGQTLTVISGGDLNLIGSQLIGNAVKADVGGNLTIQTLQDMEVSQSKQKNTSFGLTVGTGANASFSQSNTNQSTGCTCCTASYK